jgi:hypothetical protein
MNQLRCQKCDKHYWVPLFPIDLVCECGEVLLENKNNTETIKSWSLNDDRI